jgi:formylglycine-generating enzyme required for sulfatase activity/DNA-binding winged helix-turn-helix (wHTH) protein
MLGMEAGPQPLPQRKPPTALTFAGFRLDLTRGSLFREGEEVKLRPKSYETLKYLAANAGRLVPKTELVAVLWPDMSIVSDDSLTHCVMDVRRALGDEGQQFIRTVPGRGYLFAAAVEAGQEPGRPIEAPRSSHQWKTFPVAASAVIIVLAGLAWVMKNRAGREWARASVPRIEQLAAAGRYAEGYGLTLQVLAHLPAEPRVIRLISELTDDLSVSTTPKGAEVYLRRLGSTQWQRLGTTPIQHARIPRDEYLLAIRKAGYATFERTVSSTLARSIPSDSPSWDIRIEHRLSEASKVPPRMVVVPGGEYQLRSHSRPIEASAKLSDFYIDKFEVSNREYKDFIDHAGYATRQFWDPHFYESQVAQGGGLSDKTGLPGPRTWVGGMIPEGKENHPVTGVSWHEARAYCRFRAKDLPTLFQWEKAARGTVWTPFGVVFPWGIINPADAAKRANVDSTGTTPVDSFEFGMSPFGAYNMAGNVAEWTRNRYDDGFTTAGGGWRDPIYQFLIYGKRPVLYSADTLGFRCAVSTDPTGGDEGDMPLASKDPILDYPISTAEEFRTRKARYDYKWTPLHGEVVATKDSDSWRREEVAFDGHDGGRVNGFLYLPKRSDPPFQAIHYLGGSGWWFGLPATDAVEGRAARLAPYIKAGRAVFLVVLRGSGGREPGFVLRLGRASPEYRDMLAKWVIDMERGIDYLETRSEIDTRKIAFWNDSPSEPAGILSAGIQQRYASVILIGGGVRPDWNSLEPEMNPLFFAPHIRAPKLMLNGLYDDHTPERTSIEPFYRLLSEPKKRASFPAGHLPPLEIAVPLVNAWLNETLGPVAQK